MPTPVSALIHAATMVTAGVFLIVRCSSVFEFSHIVLLLLLVVGGLTALISGTIGVVQYDIKKVIAYSTCSQLGYMVIACGASNFFVSFFHLMNHAFFKALLFLCAGCIIHSCNGEQDFRVLGGLTKHLPVVFILMLVGSLSLGGFVFLTGFYSKDFIFEQFVFNEVLYNIHFLWSVATAAIALSTFFTAFYSFRLFITTFLKQYNGGTWLLQHMHESPKLMLLPLAMLFLGSLFCGFFFNDLFLGLGNIFLSISLVVFPYESFLFETDLILVDLKFFVFIALLLLSFGFNAFWVRSVFFRRASVFWMFFSKNLNFLFLFFFLFNMKWFFDCVYNRYINRFFFEVSFVFSYEFFDKLLLERFFGHFLVLGLFARMYKLIRILFQTGTFSNLFLFFFLLIIVVLGGFFLFVI